MTSVSPLAMQAEELLASKFARLAPATTRMAAFRTAGDRQLGLALARQNDIYVWMEAFDASIDGAHIQNQKRPGLPYASDQGRSSAVNSQCSNLALGNRAFYVRCDSLGVLERLATWYAKA